MARFIVSGTRRTDGNAWGPTVYVGKSGVATYSADRVFVFRTLKDAQEELDYRNRLSPAFAWAVEQLPAGRVATALLRATPVA